MRNYLLIIIVFSSLVFSNLSSAQIQDELKSTSNSIEGLLVFPNPAYNGKLTISTKFNLPKTIEIYDVLGKRIIAASILGKTLNISRLSPGIYVLKIKENKLSATKKLIVR